MKRFLVVLCCAAWLAGAGCAQFNLHQGGSAEVEEESDGDPFVGSGWKSEKGAVSVSDKGRAIERRLGYE